MNKFTFGLLGLALLFLNSCNREVQPDPGNRPGFVKLKSYYYQQNNPDRSRAVYFRYDSQNRRIKTEYYTDSSLTTSFRIIWTNNSNGLTSEEYRLEDGDSTFDSKYYWNRITGFADSIIYADGYKVNFQIKLDQYSRPELFEIFSNYNGGWSYSHDSIYDGMIVRNFRSNSSDQDTIETVYNDDDYTDFYSPFSAIPVSNVLNRNAYLKQRKTDNISFQGMSKGFLTKIVYDNGVNIWSREYTYE